MGQGVGCDPRVGEHLGAGLEPTLIERERRSKGRLGPQAQGDPAVREFVDWMGRYNAQASLRDQNDGAGYERAQALGGFSRNAATI